MIKLIFMIKNLKISRGSEEFIIIMPDIFYDDFFRFIGYDIGVLFVMWAL